MSDEVKDIKEEVSEVEAAEQDFQKTAAALTGFDEDIFATQEEIASGVRYFEAEYNGVILNLSVRKPSNKEIDKADWEYSKYFNKAVTEGIIPQSAMLAILNNNSSWTDEDEKYIAELTSKLATLEIELDNIDRETRDVGRLEAVRNELRVTRAILQEKRVEKQSYLFHTAEQKCEERKTRVLVALVTEYADGPKKGLNVFADQYKSIKNAPIQKGNSNFIKEFEALQQCKEQNFVITCYINYLTLINGLAADFLSRSMPEDKVFDWEGSVSKTAKVRGRHKKVEEVESASE